MTTAGIVRRIDELGRIVIPKEMRRTMHLKEGDEMEILSSGDALTLRKYSSFESVLPIIRSAAKLLAKATDSNVLFVNTTEVTVAEGKNKKKCLSSEDSTYFEPVIVGGDLIGGAALLLDGEPSEVARAYLNFCVELICAALM